MSGSVITPDTQRVLHPGYFSGGWYTSLTGVASSLTVPSAANTIYLCPFQLLRPASFSAVAIRVGTAVPGVSGKLALYDNDGGPLGAKNRVATGVCSGDMNTAGGTGVALNFPATVSLDAGWYWIASLFDGAAQACCLVQSANFAHGMAPYTGSQGIAGATSAITSAYIRWAVAQAYTAGFPDRLAGPTPNAANPGSPMGTLLAV